MVTYTKAVLALIPMLMLGAGGVRVYEDRGRILLETAGDGITMLTATGRDYSPWMSPDGSTVLFVRADPADPFRTSVYAVDTQTRKETLLLAGPVKYDDKENGYLGQPETDTTGRILFVISREGETTGALLAIDLSGQRTRYIAQASTYDVIQCGRYAGDLLVQQRKETILNKIYYVYWLYTPDGEDLGIAGPVEMDTRSLVEVPCAPNLMAPSTGTLSGTGSAVPAIRIADSVMSRRLRSRVEPAWPANRADCGAVVRLVVRISRTGNVVSAKLISGEPAMAQAAIAAVRGWQYEPWTVNGRPSEVVTTIELRPAAAEQAICPASWSPQTKH